MDQVRLSFPITKFTKLDDGSLEVEGVATDETVDSQGDVLTYEGSKAAFGGWRGNVREQHDVHKAVGKALDIVFDDAARSITVKSRISSGAPDTITKIEDEVLTCYSVGGGKPTKVSKKTVGGKTVRVVEAWPMNELSVVDAGANPNATFQLVKADGIATELLATDLPAEVQDASNRFAAAILKAVKDEKVAKEDAAAGDDPAEDASDEGAAAADAEEPKCTKCDQVHKDGIAECDKAALASAAVAHAKKGVEEAKAKHKIAQAKESLVGAQAKLEEVKGGGDAPKMDEAAKAAGAEVTEKAGEKPAADPDIAPALPDLDADPKCTCCDGGKCSGTDKCCKVCKCPDVVPPGVISLAAGVPEDGLEKKTFTAEERKKLAESGEAMKDGSFPIQNGKDLADAIKAFGRAKDKAAVKAHIKTRAKALGLEDKIPETWKAVGGEADGIQKAPQDLDISDAAAIITRIRSLRAIEAGETDVEVAQLALLDAAAGNVLDFIALEAKEPPADDAADAVPLAYSAKTSSAVLLKSLFEAFTKKPAADVPTDLFKVNHGHQLAEGIGQGLKKSLEPLSKAVAELKVGFDELKGGSANEKLEKALEGIRSTVEKIEKQPAVLMPLRNRQGLDGTSPSGSSPSARADVLLKWAASASPDTRSYLEQCARTERQS
jgi:hypothetical protein